MFKIFSNFFCDFFSFFEFSLTRFKNEKCLPEMKAIVDKLADAVLMFGTTRTEKAKNAAREVLQEFCHISVFLFFISANARFLFLNF